MSLRFVTHVERPDLRDSEQLWRSWPEFMLHDDTSGGRWGELYERFGSFQFWGLDPGSGELLVKANCVPVAFDPGRLPADGWREAIRSAVDDDAEPSILCALQILVAAERRGGGLSGETLAEMRRLGRTAGFPDLVAPVRPTLKARYPLMDADVYARWVRDDGLPFDPWLRVHARAGATIAGVCPSSMHVPGTVAEWEEWAGMEFPVTGDYVVPEALAPVRIDREADLGVYVEPNVWMHHRL
jgi:hypothetical protein